MEECFFNAILRDKDAKCIITRLLPPWRNWTLDTNKSECGIDNEWSFLQFFNFAPVGNSIARDYSKKPRTTLTRCKTECKKRCKTVEYSVALRPTSSCKERYNGVAISIPSTKVLTHRLFPTLHMKEKKEYLNFYEWYTSSKTSLNMRTAKH